jgi:hypothetical protein
MKSSKVKISSNRADHAPDHLAIVFRGQNINKNHKNSNRGDKTDKQALLAMKINKFSSSSTVFRTAGIPH